MRHDATVTFAEVSKERMSRKVYIDMVEWTVLFYTLEDQVCLFAGPTLHEALIPYTFEFDLSLLNENGNAYKGSTFTTHHTMDRETLDKEKTLWGRSKWQSIHLVKKQADGSIRVRLRVKLLTSESSFSLAVLNSFLRGEAQLWPAQVHKECERLHREIADWERMMQETLAEQEVIKTERASLQALLDEMVLVDKSESEGGGTLPPLSHEPRASPSDERSPVRKKTRKNHKEPQELTSLDAFDSSFDALLERRSGAGLTELENFLAKCKVKVETKQKEERMCVVCWAKERSVIMLPCKHQVTCSECADALMGSTKTCPTCRATIEETINPFH